MRAMRVRVLPVPGPAETATTASGAETAAACSGLSPSASSRALADSSFALERFRSRFLTAFFASSVPKRES